MTFSVPMVRAVMARRILVNYRVRPDALRALLPPPFAPKLVEGWGMAGICLIRLKQMRPAFLPAGLGFASENAAHRIAVEWNEEGRRREGVFIPRRDTDSQINWLAGGRLFPGVHHLADFYVFETDRQVTLDMRSRDHEASVRVAARVADDWPGGSLFATLDQASAFLRKGACGWSTGSDGRALEGVELCPDLWDMTPLRIDQVESSYFSDRARFKPGDVELDSALLMRGIPHAWRTLPADLSARRPRRHGSSALFQMP